MTIEQLKRKWLGRLVCGSAHDAERGPRPVTAVHYSPAFGRFLAYAGERHLANTPEALDRLLSGLEPGRGE